MGKIINIQDQSDQRLYPKTLSNAVYNPDTGKTVEREIIDSIKNRVTMREGLASVGGSRTISSAYTPSIST